ncbi:hypothetical protein IOD16_18255 [Saccharothrix sp. 6-C]|uniref:hypothetical protein n=1 Tax=Saccharothrix sp. 6-C TaxID=2781735 RepID=UPI001916D4E8|nr:hypothetical protein [Saccharothrix sp. 6-C]QQQ80154.1 hypothetical protein IOD16_18255 [Saccharothrix sp. 6-C]
MPQDEHVQIEAREWRSLALPQPLSFAPPYASRSTNPDGYRYWWQLIRFVFDLPDPNKFPPLEGFTPDELRVLERYVDTCYELSESTVLSSKGGIRVSFKDGVEQVSADLPSKEALRGTVVLFRQLASTEEPASYNKTRKIIGRRVNFQADSRRDERIEWQQRWNRAHGLLSASLLTAMADRKVIERMGGASSLPVPGEDVKPQEILSLFQYGDLIHWARNAEEMQALMKDEFLIKWRTVQFIEVVIQLSHFYMGYSLLVSTAIKRSAGSS